MTGFALSWLDLREAADARARNGDVASALAGYFAQRTAVRVVDLGSGSGANLRATAPLLPDKQSWRLIDNDAALLKAARTRLIAWADASEDVDANLRLHHERRVIDVTFEVGDLARAPFDVLGAEPIDLVTASALFDLVSVAKIRDMARDIASRKIPFHAVLTYNGVQRYAPHRPSDNQVIAAFNRHQARDKGFGPAAGPSAPIELADQFRLNGYLVTEGDSPWQLDKRDTALIEELMRGTAAALSERDEKSASPGSSASRPTSNSLAQSTIDAWVAVKRSNVQIGHVDMFAVPGTHSAFDDV